LNNKVVFWALDALGNQGIWATDGSASQLLIPDRTPMYWTVAANRLFIAVHSAASGMIEMWSTDGSILGTQNSMTTFVDIKSRALILSGNYYYFGADDGSTGVDPWRCRAF
jgi:hypothetical protein